MKISNFENRNIEEIPLSAQLTFILFLLEQVAVHFIYPCHGNNFNIEFLFV